jgi:hypothetical protein
MMAPTINQMLASPDHYLHSFEGDEAVFVPMDRAAYRRSIFLDRRISVAADGAVRVAVTELLTAKPARAPSNWIFHVAHCGSTLLARALDELINDVVLREPLALRQLAMAPEPSRLRLVLALLSRRYPGSGATTIKANVPVNFLLDEIIPENSQDRAILLHCSLPDYLLAILRSDNHRVWLRNVTAQLNPYLGDLSQLSDAERGAALWIAQMRRFASVINRLPATKSLNAELFFAKPALVLATVADHFGSVVDEAAIAAITTGPLFSTYSKNPEHAFSNADRLQRRSLLIGTLSKEIAAAERWIAANAADADSVTAALSAAAIFRVRTS